MCLCIFLAVHKEFSYRRLSDIGYWGLSGVTPKFRSDSGTRHGVLLLKRSTKKYHVFLRDDPQQPLNGALGAQNHLDGIFYSTTQVSVRPGCGHQTNW